MTPTEPGPGAHAAGSARALVDDVTVVVLRDGPAREESGDRLPLLLDALAAQTRLPHRVLVAGLDPDDDQTPLREHPLLTRVRVPVLTRPTLPPISPGGAAPATWQVLDDARAALPVHAAHWLWLLHEDSLPEPGALEALASAVRRNSRVGVVGPKLVRDDDPRLLVGVGQHVTVGGRAADGRHVALVDQGQLDLRQDVLGVPLAGALVRSDVLDEVGGLDPAFGADGVEGLDLGWRTHLTGHRVVVAPDAVVRQGEAGLGVVDPRRTRVRQRQVALARGSAWSAPWRALGILVTSALAALVLLLVKRPRDAADEWADVRAVLSPARGWGARWRFRRRRTVRPGDLRGLFVPVSTGWRSTLDSIGEALDPRSRAGRPDAAGVPRGAVETGPVSDEFSDVGLERSRRRLWSWPLAGALVVSVAVTAWQWRGLLTTLAPGRHGVVGPELGAVTTGADGLWRSALDGWRGGGLGHDQAAEPWLVPLSGLTRLVETMPGADGTAAGTTIAWLLFLAAPAGVLTAYLALRRSTRRRWLRAGLALGWTGLAPLPAAVEDGRVGPVVVHVLAPLLVAGYAVAAARGRGTRRTAATFATALALALAAQWVPLVLVPATLGGLLILALGRGVRWRGAVLAVLPWLLLLPWLPGAWADPVRVLGGAGATVASTVFPSAPPAWQTLLLHAGGPGAAVGQEAVGLWLTLPLWLAALGALALRGRRGRRAAVLLTGSVLTLALALLAPRVALGVLPAGHVEQGRTVTVWAGTLLSLCGAGLLLAAGLLLDRLLAGSDGRRRSHGEVVGGGAATRSWRRTVAAAVSVLVVGAGAGSLAWAGLARPVDGLLRESRDPLPAVAAEQSRGPSALRTLVLVPGAPDDGGDGEPVGRLSADLVGAEPEPARVLRDRARDLAVGASATGPVVTAVEGMTGSGSPAQAAEALLRLGVGYVLVEADASAPLVGQVDGLPGLTRVSSPQGQVLWRMVDNRAARVRVVDADGVTLSRLVVEGPHGVASGAVDGIPPGASLQVAEGAGWAEHAQVSVDGQPVAVAAGSDPPSVALPEGSHTIAVSQRPPSLAWHLLALALAAVTAFLALPVGRAEPDRQEEPGE